MGKQANILVGLDIGTTEVRCVIGAAPAPGEKEIQVLGIGCALNEGVNKGVVEHYEEVIGAVDSAIKQAQVLTGHTVRALTVNVNGSHLRSQINQAEIAISNPERLVGAEDRILVDNKAREVELGDNRSLIQYFPKNYRLDEQANIKDPIDMQGNVLGVEALLVTGLKTHLEPIERLCQELDIKINNRTISSLAAAEAVFDRKAREAGLVVLDIGYKNTNLIVIKDGEIEHIAVLPIGGWHITNDLAIGLRLELEMAEFLKVNHAAAQVNKKGTKTIRYEGQDVLFQPSKAAEVIAARLEELAEEVDQELVKIGYSQQLPGGVVLAGGSSQIEGIESIFKNKLGLSARLGQLQSYSGLVESINRREHLTAVGLMSLDYVLAQLPDKTIFRPKMTKVWQDLRQRFKKD